MILKRHITLKNLILSSLLFSVFTFKIGTINFAIGDFMLVICDILIIFYLSSSINISSNRKKYLVKCLFFLLVYLFLCLGSFGNYVFRDSDIVSSIIAFIKVAVAVNYGLVFSFYFSLSDESEIKEFLYFLLMSGLIVALFAILGVLLYQMGVETPLVMNGGRATSFMSDTNILAIFLLSLLPLIMIYRFRHSVNRWIYLSIYFLAILSTASKAAILVMLFLLISYISLLLFTGNFRKVFKAFLLIVSIISMLFIMLKYTNIFNLLLTRLGELNTGDTSQLTTGRSDLWGFAVKLIFSNFSIFLFGIGYSGFAGYILTRDVPYYLSNIILVHNTYLSMFLETGILNFLLMIFVSVYLLLKYLVKVMNEKNHNYILMLLSLMSLIIGMNEVNLQNSRFVYILLVFYFYRTTIVKLS